MAAKNKHLIAFLTPVGFGMHGQIMNGLMNSPWVKNDDFRVFHFFSRGITEEAIKPIVETILDHPFAAIVSVGVSCAHVARKVLAEKKATIPHVFVGVTDPFKYGLGDSPEDLIKHNMTGVMYDPYDIKKAMQFLCESKPAMKKMLVVTDRIGCSGTHLDTEWIDKEVAAIKSVCAVRGIEVNVHAAQSGATLFSHVREVIHTFDTLVLLEGGLSISIFEPLGSLCNQFHKTLFSGLLDPVKTSAAIGYGASYESMGALAIQYVHKLLVEGTPISHMPLLHQENTRRPVVNLKLAAQQDLDAVLVEKVCNKWNGIVIREIESDI